jgi:putative ABC transport system substrate-binding protein
MMRRREFITLLGGAAAACPLAAQAQQPALPVIGWLDSASLGERREVLAGFHTGLQEISYREGQNVMLAYSWAEHLSERIAPLAIDLARRQVAVIVASGAACALAAKEATAKIPIVFGTGGDPVRLGLVSSLNRPGGNLTGVATLGNALASKQLQLLRDLAPGAKAIAYLTNPTNPNAQSDVNDVQTAAGALRLQVNVLNASTPNDIDLAFATIARQQLSGVLVANDPFLNSRVSQVAQLALTQKLPSVFPHREAVPVGGLISYGAILMETGRAMGIYTGRILRGEKPGDLAIVQTAKFQFVINLITAKSLGLTVPPALLAIADEVFE